MSVGAKVVDWDALLSLVVASLVVSTAVAAVFSLAIYGSTRFVDLRRSDRAALAALHGALALLSLLVVLGVCVFGLILVLRK